MNTEARCATVAGLLEALNLTAVAYVLEPPPPQADRVNKELPDKSKGLTPKACKKFLLLLSVGGWVGLQVASPRVEEVQCRFAI